MVISLILFIADILAIYAAFLLSFVIRYKGNFSELDFASYQSNHLFLTLICMLTCAFARVFNHRFKSYWELATKISTGLFLGTLFNIAFLYVFRAKWLSFPSSVLVISFPVGWFFLFMVNGLILRLTGRIKKKIVIIGREETDLTLKKSPLIGYRRINTTEELLQCRHIDEVVICERIHEDSQLNLLIFLLLKLRVNVTFSPSVYSTLLSQNIMGENSIKFLATFAGRKSEFEEFLIRAFDISASIVLLVLLSPLIAVVALLIKLTSPGSVFYKQTRVAKDGKPFTIYKFKTMVDNTDKNTPPDLAVPNDPRITKIGGFLRATHINELPQLYNVIRGDMSLVGPRPDLPHSVRCHEVMREIRLAVKPGITGLAQIRNSYDLQPKHIAKYDYLYIQRRSFLLNLSILMKTIPVVFSRTGW